MSSSTSSSDTLGLSGSDDPLPNFDYQPLLPHHIRLLCITHVSCELRIVHTDIASAPPYTAVSYTGNQERPEKYLNVGGCRLGVIPNVFIALSHLIQHADTNHLWIDGICINQEDEAEKQTQIPLMGEVYSHCQSCLIWLGTSDQCVKTALDALPRIARTLETGVDRSTVWEAEGLSAASKAVLENPLWKGLTDIYTRPWFKRVWTYQEAVLPPEVTFLVDSRSIPFDDIAAVAAPLLNHLGAMRAAFTDAGPGTDKLFVGFLKISRISQFRASRTARRTCLDTLRLLYFTNTWSASNRMDKVYGVLGLTDRSFQESIAVTYSETAGDLSLKIVRWYIDNGEDLYFLNLATSGNMVRRTGLPTWIPDFTSFGSHWGICRIWNRFRAGMINDKPFPDCRPLIRDGKLYVKGLLVDEVSHIVPGQVRSFQTQTERYQKILVWEDACLAASRTHLNATDPVPEAHWRTLISAACNERVKPAFSEYVLLMAYLRSVAAGERSTPELEMRRQDFLEQIRRLWQVATLGIFYCTRDGRIGIGPRRTQLGDKICIFYNGQTPFILRSETPAGLDPEWSFIGDSYTWSMMHGEVFEDAERRWDTFVLV